VEEEMRTYRILSALIIAVLLLSLSSPITARSQEVGFSSTSPSVQAYGVQRQGLVSLAAVPGAITFGEYALGTHIGTQYANRGIVFAGDDPYIWTDGANPTSPVLSGSPLYRGAIEGRFVDPSDGTTPTIVQSFSLDAGYFDEIGSTRIEWFDPSGKKLGQRTNTHYGIERFDIEGGNIARWRISIILTEPAGYAIDNVSLQPAQASVLFRESGYDKQRNTWGLLGDDIPGWDHSALNVSNLVYESHPGYDAGTYISEDGQESVEIQKINGAQAQFTVATFKYESTTQATTLIDFEELPIDVSLAEQMKSHIEEQIAAGAEFRFIDFSSVAGRARTLAPDQQKGGDDRQFTCVGLIEWSAEQSGYNGGQGFIKDAYESIGAMPLLSPWLLNWTMKYAAKVNDIKQWYQGIFDPADFMITDPLGRKLGYTPELGEKNEIPGAFYSGNGTVEQFLIPNPVAGNYTIELYGLNAQVAGAMASSLHAVQIDQFMAQGNKQVSTFLVEVVSGSPGDVNLDGSIDQSDISALNAEMNTFTNDPNDPADIDGDGLIGPLDITLLNELLNIPSEQPPTLNVPDAQTVQYSDSLSFNVSATDPDNSGSELAFGASGLPDGILLADNMDGTATISGTALADPNTYTVEFTVTDPGGLTDTKTVSIVVTKEDARATYSGPMFVSTGCATCTTASVPLRATIQDITAVIGDPSFDPNAGDITHASVSFVNRSNNAVLCTSSIVLQDPTDTTVGSATCNWTPSLGSNYGLDYTIGTIVDGYYTRNSVDDDAIVVVSKPTSNFITGGGFVVNQKSGGTYSGSVGHKTNFGLNIKFTKSLTNLQGRVTIIVRHGDKVYQIKSTALSSLVAVPYSASNPGSGTAELIGKATITDVTNPAAPIAVAGNAKLDVIMKDNGQPGSSDLIGVSLWGSNGKLLFSSNWNGTKTVKQLLGGGNLSIK
jgi:hypothetical protein